MIFSLFTVFLLWSALLALVMFLVGFFAGVKGQKLSIDKDCEGMGNFRTDKAVYSAYKIKDTAISTKRSK